jgi:uncharacterized protein (DUF1501 family)
MPHPLLPRREFLKYSALLSSLPWWSALEDGGRPMRRGDRILVVIELNGGNDGINTVVPFRDEGYGKHRTELRLAEDKLLKLDDALGLHPSLTGMNTLWQRSELAIVQGVGYPDPNLSHQVSLAMWHTGGLDRVERGYGWIGRALDTEQREGEQARRAPRALLAGPHALTLALRARKTPVATVPDIATYLDAGDIGTDGLLASKSVSELAEHMRAVLADARATTRSLRALENDKQTRKPYPASRLATELELISRLIRGGFDTSVYYAIQNGFDTHALQPVTHSNLLQQLGDALLAFLDDLRENGRGKDVLVLVFSEFGRRVEENASRGTDHGTAGPVFLAGAPVRSGIYGKTPSLLDLDDGNLKTTVDFRRVYASVLKDWLRVDPTVILGAGFEPLPLL